MPQSQTPNIVAIPPQDRSNDPVSISTTNAGMWGDNYALPNPVGSGWMWYYNFPSVLPRSIEPKRGDLVGLDWDYNVDFSFASAGNDSLDISNQFVAKFGYTHNSLFEASIDGSVERVEQLVQEHPELINDQVKVGDCWTALHGAVAYNQVNVVELLLSKGADANLKDSMGRTAYSIAKKTGASQCLELMVKNKNKEEIEELESNYETLLKSIQSKYDEVYLSMGYGSNN